MTSNLAHQLRPTSLKEFVGQDHLVGHEGPIKKSLDKKHLSSMIFWGPPGVGKTTLAQIIANHHDRDLHQLSAVSAGKNDVRRIVKESSGQKKLTESYQAPILFLDEIHRFNKAQQDYLLPYVEDGSLILLGATTQNPSFEIIPALLSRTKVFVMKALDEKELVKIIKKAVDHYQSQNKKSFSIDKQTQDLLIRLSGGDARYLLNLIEQAVQNYNEVTQTVIQKIVQKKFIDYDKQGEAHYDTISAFIKSMRASDTDAALYYLARMVEAGEDPKFIARRMIVFASEDIGLANPTALVVANAVFEAIHKIGYPEAQINLAHGVTYLCKCPKDRSAYDAYFKTLDDVKLHGNLPIPLKIRNAPTKLMKEIGYGQGYKMYTEESLLPEKLKNKKYLKTRKKNA